VALIVVTGGAGFIGSNVVAALAARGRDGIVVCDSLGNGEKWRNLAKHEIAALVPPEGLTDFLLTHAADISALIHMAAISSTTESDADLMVAGNFGLSLRLWDWCAAHAVRFIYASSAATYGDGTQGFDDDGSVDALARLRPLNLYGWTKHLFDRRLARLVQHGARPPPQWAGLKFFNVYGPNEYHKEQMRSVAHQVYQAVRAGGPVRLFKSHQLDYADGGQRRDFIWVGDCVDVIEWLIDTPEINGLFNLGSGTARSFADLATAVLAAVGRRDIAIEYIDMPEPIRARYQYFTEAPMERLRAAGYTRPLTTIEAGIAAYVGDYLTTADPYR